jgi:hypothetical protein
LTRGRDPGTLSNMSTTTAHVYSVRLPDGRNFGPVDGPTLIQWARDGRIAWDTRIVSSSGKEAAACDIPDLRPLLAPPPVARGSVAVSPGDEAIATIIPYRNRAALIGYYLSIAGLLPLLGVPFAPTALVLGIKGFGRWKRDRAVKGVVHAWIAIILGLIGCVINGLILFALVMAASR